MFPGGGKGEEKREDLTFSWELDLTLVEGRTAGPRGGGHGPKGPRPNVHNEVFY